MSEPVDDEGQQRGDTATSVFEEERDQHAERIRRELGALVRNSGITQRRIEQLNRYHRGYVSQVLQGHITLTMRHVVGILMAIDMPTADFFARLFGAPVQLPPGTDPDIEEIRERLARYDDALRQLTDKGLLDT